MAVAEKVYGSRSLQEDVIPTSGGPLVITCVGHGTLMLSWGGLVVHVDPVSEQGPCGELPKADVILITHHHSDHFEPAAVEKVRKADTELVLTPQCTRQIEGGRLARAAGMSGAGRVARNGDHLTVRGLPVEAVPAYNVRHKRPDGRPFHAPGEGNGYVVTFGDKRVYIAGDTEDIPEMRALRSIDVAFLPMNLPYTMTPEMVAAAAKAFRPSVLYPYHTGDTDLSLLPPLLAGVPGIEVRLRRLA